MLILPAQTSIVLRPSLYFIVFSLFFSCWLGAQELAFIDSLPPNMYLDTNHAPFHYGVTSGDPLPDGVIIWTRVSPQQPDEVIGVSWEVATDKTFNTIVQQGTYAANPVKDWTVKVDVGGLQPYTTYYYRFQVKGKYSAIGRTKTAPDGHMEHLRVAGMSCSSIYSGYFNAYARVGERDDLDLVVHLGDYIYDFVDGDEKVRVPLPYPHDPQNLTEFRNRHKYYLTDPDLRLARQQQPWVLVWDNHDIDVGHPEIDVQAKQAFYEYLPIRVTDTVDVSRIYRQYKYGDLFELFMLDMDSYVIKVKDDSLNATFLGEQQKLWLEEGLKNSTARWKIIGSQKMVAGWYSKGLPFNKKIPGNGIFFDPSSFDGYYWERDSLLRFIDANNIDNVFVLSGDMHMSFVMNLSPDPKNRKAYKRRSGKGSVGVELLATSISRGNFDESGIPKALIPAAQRLSKKANPHHVWVDFMRHGYGLLDITPDRIVAELWYSPILYEAPYEEFGGGWRVRNGRNRWDWGRIVTPTEP